LRISLVTDSFAPSGAHTVFSDNTVIDETLYTYDQPFDTVALLSYFRLVSPLLEWLDLGSNLHLCHKPFFLEIMVVLFLI
jgi:hypothetical protein